MKVADRIVEQLIRSGVRRVFGVGGANIEDMFAAVQRRRPQIAAVLAKHEHGAGTAALGYARVSGSLGVVLATSGGGTLNLVHAMAEARASRLPVLAIVGEPPSDVQGVGAFQDTSGRAGALDAATVLGAVATWCKRAENASAVPQLLAQALAHIAVESGCAVLLIAKDRQRADIETPAREESLLPQPQPAAIDLATLRAAAARVSDGPCVIIAGDEVSRAHAQPELAKLARVLGAPVAVAPDARDAFDNFDPRFVGVAGAMGHERVAQALARARVCVLVGTRLPLLARMGLEARLRELTLVSVGRELPFVAGSARVHVASEVQSGLRSLLAMLGNQGLTRPAQSDLPPPLPAAVSDRLTSAAVLATLEPMIAQGSPVIVDAGNTGANAVHHLRAPNDGPWLLAMGMAGMGYAFGAAVGAAFASGKRCYVIAGDGAFYMHGFEIHTAIEHALPITYLIFNNRAHGMCLVRERLLLQDNAGYNAFRRAHIGAGLAAMFPGLNAHDCTNLDELTGALRTAAALPGPSVIAIELEDVEVPPFVAFQAANPTATVVSRGASHEGK